MKEKITRVIDVKKELRNEIMKIGHSGSVSETFLPTQKFCPTLKINFTDVAGQSDTRGELFEIINMLLIKKLYSMAD